VDSLVVECLRCGTSRVSRRDIYKHLETPECQHCGYLGWQPILEVTESDRRRRPRLRKLSELRQTSVA
jgi:Zn ribbon nucleic-acid-binding protein